MGRSGEIFVNSWLSFQRKCIFVIDKDLNIQTILVEKIDGGLEGCILDLLHVSRGHKHADARLLVRHRTTFFSAAAHAALILDCITWMASSTVIPGS